MMPTQFRHRLEESSVEKGNDDGQNNDDEQAGGDLGASAYISISQQNENLEI